MVTRTQSAASNTTRILGSRVLLLPGLLLCTGLLLLCLMGSIMFGAADISPDTVFAALFNSDGSFNHMLIQTVRLPRVLAGALVGAGLAVAGAVM